MKPYTEQATGYAGSDDSSSSEREIHSRSSEAYPCL
jgi:hypothetical protein